ncbi:hypothetical protein K3495_g6754 [Podosphaera aphanis]|nr:hypothetical protein K3495_g6754 [Podosphaera aphanis]
MAKSQQPPPLAQRVAEELELVRRVAKATIAGSPATVPGPTSARPNTTHRPSCTPVSKQTAITKGPKAIFRLSEEAPLLRADATSVKAAFIQIVLGPKDGIAFVSRNSNGFTVAFSSDSSLKIAMDNAASIKASLSGPLVPLEDRIGYVVMRIPRTIWNPVSNLVPTTLDDVKSIAQARTGVAPIGAHWSLHEDCYELLHTAVIFFPKEFNATLALGFINPPAVALKLCVHDAVLFVTMENAATFVGASTAWGRILQTTLTALSALALLRANERRAQAAATAASSATPNLSGSSSALPLFTEAPSVPPQRSSAASQNRFISRSLASDGSMEVDLDEQGTQNTPISTPHEQ